MGYYLMIKSVEIKGKSLHYLCKMKKDGRDPYVYPGSGVLWTRYLSKYKPKIETTILGFYETSEELKDAGVHASKLFNVVDSDDWANLIPEIGDGGSTTKNKLRCYNPLTKEERLLSKVPEGWIRGSQYNRNKDSVVCHNPLTGKLKRFKKDQILPEGWVKGGVKGKYSYGPRKGAKAYYDSRTKKKVVLIDTLNIPENLVKGFCYSSTKDRVGFYNMHTKKKKYFKLTDSIPEGWIRGIPPTTGKSILTPRGEFRSITEAMKTLSLSRESIQKNIRSNVTGWSYI